MNEYYALDPNAPKSARDLADLYRIFASDSGRFLYTLPETWQEDMIYNMRQISDLCGARAEEFLRNAITLRWSAKPSKRLNWDEIAFELIDETRALLGERDIKPHIRALDSVLADISFWVDVSEGHIKRDAKEYAMIAEPIFRASPKVSMVDPYFRLRYRRENSNTFVKSKRHSDTLTHFIRLAARHRKVRVLCLFVNEEHALEGDPEGIRFQSDLCSIKNSVPGAESLIVEYRKLSKESSFDSHPRYLLGHKAGLKFDWGFESRPEDPKTQHLAWIGRSALEPLLDRFL